MLLSSDDWSAILLSLQLASIVTVLLLFIGTPIAWWLANTRSILKGPISAIVALPLILPPTVLGFYLLLLLGPQGAVGQWMLKLGMNTLPFTFSGLVVASLFYSLPFVVQPIQNAIEAVGDRPHEVAATLRAGPWERFIYVTLPLAKPGLLTATVLGFAHTIGEFGIILMIGGNIPGETKVISIQIYDHVETLNYAQAHVLSLVMVGFSFISLLILYSIQKRNPMRLGG